MFWGDRIVSEIKNKYSKEIASGKKLIIRDEKTLSGRVHVGSLRGVVVHGIIKEILDEGNVDSKYLFELNDFDVMDGLPVYLDQERFSPFMGRLLCDVPSPDGKANNYAEYFGEEFAGVINGLGFKPEYYRSSDLYREGKYNESIRKVLDNASKIREIYKRVSGSEKPEGWLPIHVLCENCKKIATTKATKWDGNELEYECGDFVKYTKGCGHKGKISPFDGRAKLPWKVEWAAKFTVLDVQIEGGGKDHSTKGGAREVADTISREVLDREPPFNIPYEFLLVGGKKMSSSKGLGSSAKEISELLPPELFRTLVMQKELNRVVDFVPDGDTIPILYDFYDGYAKKYFEGANDDLARIFYLAHKPEDRGNITERHLPRFFTVAFISQMPHIDPVKEIEKLQEITLTEDDKKELNHRLEYVRRWIQDFAPEEYKSEIQKEVPESAKNLSEIQKKALGELVRYIELNENLDGQGLHSKLHEIKESTQIDPKEFFQAIYLSILGKTSGPKAGWFLSVLDRDFLIKRFREVI